MFDLGSFMCVQCTLPIPFMQIAAQVIVKETSRDWWPLACVRDKYIQFGRLFHRYDDAQTLFYHSFTYMEEQYSALFKY